MTRRIGIGGIYHESNTFVSRKTGVDHFVKNRCFWGQEIYAEYTGGFHELSGVISELEKHGAEIVPLFYAEAVPGGTIDAVAEEFLVGEMLRQLESSKDLDGLVFAVHGAAVSELHSDMDGYWLSKVREFVGSEVPIFGTLDPHANLSQSMLDVTDVLISYRTNPHVDQVSAGVRAAELLMKQLNEGFTAVQVMAKPNCLIGIERQRTALSPCRELYELAADFESEAEILAANVLLGFPYADVCEMGASFLVVAAHKDVDLAQTRADQLAAYLWNRRRNFCGDKIDIEQALAAIESLDKPVLVLDTGDNIGGGSPGDGTSLLEALERVGKWRSFICIQDPEAVAYAEALNKSSLHRFRIGGKTDALHGDPVEVNARIQKVLEGSFKETEPRHGGQTSYNMGRMAILETDKGTTIQVTSRRTPPFSLRQMTAFALNPESYEVIVAKGVHAPIAAYEAVCRSEIQVATPGCTQIDLTCFPYRNRCKPLYPFEDYDPSSFKEP
ncbi:MAG: M81 family metallopeptidase [Opitutales bacterium]|nr:M81 family metallopeptidase [Opitutales bacterium]